MRGGIARQDEKRAPFAWNERQRFDEAYEVLVRALRRNGQDERPTGEAEALFELPSRCPRSGRRRSWAVRHHLDLAVRNFEKADEVISRRLGGHDDAMRAARRYRHQ